MYKAIQYIDPSKITPGLFYKEFIPSDSLKKYVSCFWRVYSEKPLPSITHRILPDGCSDIIFNLRDTQFFFTGLADKTEYFPVSEDVSFFGIRFLPQSIPYILKHNAAESLNSFVEIDPANEILFSMCHRILDAKKPDLLISICEKHLELFFRDYSIHHTFETLLQHALAEKGILTVHDLALYHSISEKQIGRYFRSNIGMLPKTFLKIIRFQNAIASLSSTHHTTIRHAIESGYYDQSHLIKDLHYFLGGIDNIY